MASITALPMPSSGHIQDLSQARVIRALPVTVSQIPTERADRSPAIRALLCLGPWLEEPGRDPGPAVGLRTVPSLCRRSCGFKRPRDVDPSGPGAQSGCYCFGGDLLGAAADWEQTPILQSDVDHLLDAGAAVFMATCGADQLGRFDFLVARDASTVKRGGMLVRLIFYGNSLILTSCLPLRSSRQASVFLSDQAACLDLLLGGYRLIWWSGRLALMRSEDSGDSAACCLLQVQHLQAVASPQEVWQAAEAGLRCCLYLVLHLQPMASDEIGEAPRTAKDAGQILGRMLSIDLHQEVGCEIETGTGTVRKPSV